MDRINGIATTAPTAPSKESKDSAAEQFSAVLDRIKNGTPEKDKNEDDESKTIIERTVVTAPDGSKMLVVTQVTLKPNGQRGETKVLSRQKIASPNTQTVLESGVDKKKEFDPDYNTQWQDTGTGEMQQKYAQSGVNGLLKPGDVLTAFQ